MHEKDFMRSIGIPVVVAVLTVFIMMGIFFTWIQKDPTIFSNTFSTMLVADSYKSDSDISPSKYSSESIIIDTVKKSDPAVVSITITKNLSRYGRYFEVGGGSGFLISEDGYIVTNSHVVNDSNAQYMVTLSDSRKFKAKIVTLDPNRDLALIKISGNDFPYLKFADSNQIEIGQSVIAIGNALAEFRNSVSLGIVSGLGRTIIASDMNGNLESLEELIQTDAAINEGNSGGPLLNLDGEVIGVSVAIAKNAENIGFAIKSNTVKKMVDAAK